MKDVIGMVTFSLGQDTTGRFAGAMETWVPRELKYEPGEKVFGLLSEGEKDIFDALESTPELFGAPMFTEFILIEGTVCQSRMECHPIHLWIEYHDFRLGGSQSENAANQSRGTE